MSSVEGIVVNDEYRERRCDFENSEDERRRSKIDYLKKKALDASNKFTHSLKKRGKGKIDYRVSSVSIEDVRDAKEESADTPDDQDELKKLKGSKYRDMVDYFKSGWNLLMTNLILELASAVFDQLGYALVGMVLAFVALLLSTAELIYMERMSLLPSFHRPSTTTLAPGKPVGTIVEYFGLFGAVWQCFYSTVEYAYARQKKDNPIKMSLLPFIFLSCVVISKLRDEAAELGDLRNKYGDFQVTFSNENQELIIPMSLRLLRSLCVLRLPKLQLAPIPLPLPSYNGKISCLKEFYCFGCKSMKKFPLVFLQNLEVIEVSDCEKMVEIIETKSDDEGLIDEESSRSSRNTKLELPKLKELKLIKLPELKSISSSKLICNSLKLIHIRNCEKLKRIPIVLPFLESSQSSPHPSLEIIIHPEERWESALEWDHPNAKDALRRFVKFQ